MPCHCILSVIFSGTCAFLAQVGRAPLYLEALFIDSFEQNDNHGKYERGSKVFLSQFLREGLMKRAGSCWESSPIQKSLSSIVQVCRLM